MNMNSHMNMQPLLPYTYKNPIVSPILWGSNQILYLKMVYGLLIFYVQRLLVTYWKPRSHQSYLQNGVWYWGTVSCSCVHMYSSPSTCYCPEQLTWPNHDGMSLDTGKVQNSIFFPVVKPLGALETELNVEAGKQTNQNETKTPE